MSWPKSEDEIKKKLVHKGWECDGCDIKPIVGTRYSSQKLKDFSLCEKCYKTRGEDLGMAKHPFTAINHLVDAPSDSDSEEEVKPVYKPIITPVINPVVIPKPVYKPIFHPVVKPVFGVGHKGILCDNCSQKVVGTRYKCLNRVNYDLCHGCFPNRKNFGMHYGKKWGVYEKSGKLSYTIPVPSGYRPIKRGKMVRPRPVTRGRCVKK